MARGSITVLAAALLVVSSCGGSGGRQVTVFAASSLTDALGELERAYEAEHPGVDVVLVLGGSSSLAAQIEEGAPVDVFAAADSRTMQRAVDSGRFEMPVELAGNVLAIAVEAGNPRGVVGLADLAEPGLVVVLAAPEVPAGAYAAEVLERAGVDVEVDSYEPSVRSVATKVALGEADVGIVFRTDVAADPGRLDGVPIPAEDNVVASYPIAIAHDAGQEARGFVDLLVGPNGRAVLAAAGFEAP